MNRSSWMFTCAVVGLLACLCFLGLIGGGAFLTYDSFYSLGLTQTAQVPPTLTRVVWTPVENTAIPDTLVPTVGPTPEVSISAPPPPEALESQLSLEQADPPAGDLVELTERLKGIKNIPRVLATSAAPIPLGARNSFNILNADNDRYSTVTAEMRYATAHVYFWVEDGVKASDRDIKNLVDEFENKTYPTDREFFGSEWTPGVDGDVHLYILFARGLGSNVGGYFGSVDEFSRQAFPYSNQHEMFFVNADTSSLSEDYTRGTLAHEFQHMIHWYGDHNEDGWMNEGFSELAVQLNGFDTGGHYWPYVLDTDIQLNTWSDINEESAAAHYGGSFLFMNYFLSRFGETATKALVRNPANGLKSINLALQELNAVNPKTDRPMTVDDLMVDFGGTLLLNDPALEDGRYQLFEFPLATEPTLTEEIEDCPTGVKSRQVSQFGIDYIRIACPGSMKFFFSGQTVQKLLPSDPAEGKYYLWSNRGDESDMTLTKAFDLPAGQKATLQFQLWYDLEVNYDYAYLVISTDNGETWKILQAPSSTSLNPQGANLGWGWTGKSGGGEEAQWIKEQVDLSAYAGKNVLLRFEYITDPMLNGEGLLVDDIRIPEIQYATGFEDGIDGWEAKGFVRVQNLLPQTFRVLVIRRGQTTTVDYLPLDDRMFGSLDLRLQDGEDAVIVVVGTTQFTTQKADYNFEIMQ